MGWEYHDRKRNSDGTWSQENKSRRIGIRVDDMTLGLIRGRAYARGQSMTGYILDLVRRDQLGVSRACTPTDGNCGLIENERSSLSRAGAAVPRGTAGQEGRRSEAGRRLPLPLTGVAQ